MIITTSEEWTNLYRSILEESTRSDEKHVFIYASSSDADSVCALRILEVRPCTWSSGGGPPPLQRSAEQHPDEGGICREASHKAP